VTRKAVACVFAGALLAAGSTSIAAPDQTYPGQPTQARVWIQNRGRAEAIPINVQDVAADATMRVQVSGTPTVAISTPTVFETRQARQRWEYRRLVVVLPDEELTAQLNGAGSDGWEPAMQFTTPRGDVVIILKRPLVAPR
jgi:hypothetical protein